MKARTVSIIDQGSKWACLLFAWSMWLMAALERSVLYLILGFLPYLVIHNSLVRSWVTRQEKARFDLDRSG